MGGGERETGDRIAGMRERERSGEVHARGRDGSHGMGHAGDRVAEEGAGAGEGVHGLDSHEMRRWARSMITWRSAFHLRVAGSE